MRHKTDPNRGIYREAREMVAEYFHGPTGQFCDYDGATVAPTPTEFEDHYLRALDCLQHNERKTT